VRVTSESEHNLDGRLLEIVKAGIGISGANPDYVLATQDHLTELGIHDATLERLARALRP
jgi:cation transport protein ChaC